MDGFWTFFYKKLIFKEIRTDAFLYHTHPLTTESPTAQPISIKLLLNEKHFNRKGKMRDECNILQRSNIIVFHRVIFTYHIQVIFKVIFEYNDISGI